MSSWNGGSAPSVVDRAQTHLLVMLIGTCAKEPWRVLRLARLRACCSVWRHFFSAEWGTRQQAVVSKAIDPYWRRTDLYGIVSREEGGVTL